ncbi:hypothetical protein [Tautonia sociabilis]|uniref:Uncharacterized protein n=1 Tax=Tautonia sociabilis TaxID=2080755 RepID=A0A432MFL6_9BACT|nr:hypothetical protein [Tautonia sociabilis]RUL85039.1 hypothetical protein TsocGM_19050 [Tautonia sociabilis]
MPDWFLDALTDALGLLAQAAATVRKQPDAGRRAWLSDPSTAVLVVLGATVLIGGGRRLLLGLKARRAVHRLADPDVSPGEIIDASQHGRAGLIDFFRLLEEGKSPEIRAAAARALAVVWGADDLIPEEEKAVVTRGVEVRWLGRRRYPRGLARPFSLQVRCALPFLEHPIGGISPGQIEWSYRVAGSRRASLEVPSDWKAGPILAQVPIEPADFPENGPHRLVFQARARTVGLTSSWEVDLPHVPFGFEFDPLLRVDSILGPPDEDRAAAISSLVRARIADPTTAPDGTPPRGLPDGGILPLGPDLAIHRPPSIWVDGPLPCDLAHRVFLEIEGVAGRWEGSAPLVLASSSGPSPGEPHQHEIGVLSPDGARGPDRAGSYRARFVLEPDPEAAWAHPDVRSLWPRPIVTDWLEIRVIRR